MSLNRIAKRCILSSKQTLLNHVKHFNFTHSQITFVDNPHTFEMLISDFNRNEYNQIAFDCEWKPVFIQGEKATVSIFQLAIENKVYILDVLKLNKWDKEYKYINFFKSDILCSKKCLKIGYATGQDIINLVRSFPDLNDQHESIKKSVLNLDELVSKLEKITNGKILPQATTDSRGLSKLAERCFGEPLRKNKRIIMSNWNQRPLDSEQMLYAGLDAFILLEIFKYLKERCKIFDINLNSYLTNVQSSIGIKT